VPEVATSSTALDLSRLPAPTVVEALSFEQIYAEILAGLTDRLPSFDATVESDPVVKLLQVVAYRELIIRQRFNDRALQVMTAYATGANLDQLGAIVGVARLLITAADPARGLPAIYETDDALRRRIVLAPESFSVAGPESAYVFHALSADPTIADATATSPAPGQVRVTLLSALGDGVATPSQLAAVEEVVNGAPIRPLTDQVTVASAVIVPFTVVARLFLFSGPDETVIVSAAQAKLAAYLAAARRLGRDITLSALYAQLHVEGVQRVELIEPAADIIIDRTRATFCAGVNVSVAGYGD
jgi:phage-related baseplate assembly protein